MQWYCYPHHTVLSLSSKRVNSVATNQAGKVGLLLSQQFTVSRVICSRAVLLKSLDFWPPNSTNLNPDDYCVQNSMNELDRIKQITMPYSRMILLNCFPKWLTLLKINQFYCYTFNQFYCYTFSDFRYKVVSQLTCGGQFLYTIIQIWLFQHPKIQGEGSKLKETRIEAYMVPTEWVWGREGSG